jgi:hypothetical protein
MQDFSEGKETDWTVQLTTHLQLVLRSKMHGHLPPDPIYTSMAWYVGTWKLLLPHVDLSFFLQNLVSQAIARFTRLFHKSRIIFTRETTVFKSPDTYFDEF